MCNHSSRTNGGIGVYYRANFGASVDLPHTPYVDEVTDT